MWIRSGEGFSGPPNYKTASLILGLLQPNV